MKKRVTIYIDEADWMEIRLYTVEKKISMGDYFVSLHRKKIPKPLIRSLPINEKTSSDTKEKVQEGVPEKTVSEEYKKKNPNERCLSCLKVYKFCKC